MNCFHCATPLPDEARFCHSCGADVSGATSGERTQPVESDVGLMLKLQEDVGSDYLVERELGRGGMAVVFLATDVHLGRKVAVKVLPPELMFSGGAHIIERFKREARTAATLDHPHIIPIHRVSTSGKLSWYVMKYLEGQTLADILEQEGPLSPQRTADIVAQIAQGLEYAHRRGVIHRDIKPANIALDAEGWVTVTDFGIAKALDTSSLTGSGSMIGTPYYMSPEQCAGQKVSGASDQYSLAVMAYQMLSGHLPFSGQAVVDIIKKHCMDSPPPLGVLRPALPPEVVAVVHRGLEKSAAGRFPSVRDFAAALTEAARRPPVEATLPVVRPVHAKRASETAVVQRAAEPVRQTQPPPTAAPLPSPAEPVRQKEPPHAPGPPRPPHARRSRLPIALGAAGTLALAGIVFGPLIRDAVTRRTAPPAADSLQPSEQAAIPVQPPRTAAVRALPAGPGVGGPPADTSAVAAAAAATARGTIILRAVPAGAAITLDGGPVRGSRFAVEAGRRHVVAVQATGFELWADTLIPREGQRISRTVSLRPLAQPAATPPTGQPAGAQQPRGQAGVEPQARQAGQPVRPGPTSERAAQRAEPQAAPAQQPAQQPTRLQAAPAIQPAPAGVGYLSVGTLPQSRIFVNGQPTMSNPLLRFEVRAGEVRLAFQVTDSISGTWWAEDRVVTVEPGQHLNLRRISLTRQP